uniref:DUF2188 domain-containing protein n=1 Tax=viral metagenome TaxID=1070528 RepID=A0A6M3KFY0_9ZZZZ
MKTYHVVYDHGKWNVQKGQTVISKGHTKQSGAIRKAKAVAKKNKGELYIHKRSGSIRIRHTYGKDPFPPRG